MAAAYAGNPQVVPNGRLMATGTFRLRPAENPRAPAGEDSGLGRSLKANARGLGTTPDTRDEPSKEAARHNRSESNSQPGRGHFSASKKTRRPPPHDPQQSAIAVLRRRRRGGGEADGEEYAARPLSSSHVLLAPPPGDAARGSHRPALGFSVGGSTFRSSELSFQVGGQSGNATVGASSRAYDPFRQGVRRVRGGIRFTRGIHQHAALFFRDGDAAEPPAYKPRTKSELVSNSRAKRPFVFVLFIFG